MALQEYGRAPYTSATAAVTALDAFRNRAPSGPVTPEMLIKLGVPESIARRTASSLFELELINEEGQPTSILEAFKATRGQEEYQARLQEWLRDVYAAVLQYANPSEDSIERVQEAFRGFEPEGQRKAMASLLVGLWEYAGLPLAAQETNTPPRRSMQATRPPRSRTQTSSKRSSATPQRQSQEVETPDVPAGLLGMLRELPSDRTWTSKRRDAFLNAFKAMLDFTIVVDDDPRTRLPASWTTEDSPDQEVMP